MVSSLAAEGGSAAARWASIAASIWCAARLSTRALSLSTLASSDGMRTGADLVPFTARVEVLPIRAAWPVVPALLWASFRPLSLVDPFVRCTGLAAGRRDGFVPGAVTARMVGSRCRTGETEGDRDTDGT
eukprot:6192239-Pleurochrysis_carterae.AAC.2